MMGRGDGFWEEQFWFFGLSYAMDGVIRNETLERTNQLNLLPDKD